MMRLLFLDTIMKETMSAVETYQEIYPDRTVVQVQICDIAIGGGGIHCITQQQCRPY